MPPRTGRQTLLVCSRHRPDPRCRAPLVLELDLFDVRQALQPLLGALDRGIRQPAAFELPHFAAQGLIVDRRGVVEVDVPDVDAVAVR